MISVLIADDEAIERAVLKKTLMKNLGDRCRILEAENGRQALELYDSHKYQIAVLDIEMPGISGIEAAEILRRKDKACSIIFLTAFDEFSYAKKAITVRALDYLLKPFDEKELILVMEEALRIAEKNQEDSGEELKQEEESWQDELGETEESNDSRQVKVTQMMEEYIKANYMYEISMQDAAKAMNYSETYFSKLFKQCFQKNFTAYLTEFRVEEAKRQLQKPTVNVKDVGKAVGYGDSNYFTKVFRRITGMSPTEYRTSIFREE